MKLYILGAGQFSHCIFELASGLNKYSHIYFLDDDLSKNNVVAPLNSFTEYIREDAEFIIAIGNNTVRMDLLKKLLLSNASVATLIHPRSFISNSAHIGQGTIVMPLAIVNSNSYVGNGCIIDCGSIVDHNCKIQDGIHIKPGAVIRPGNIISFGTDIRPGEVIEANTMH